MKTILEKYKIPLIRGGILLGVVILIFTISFGNLKQNTDRDKAKSGAVSEVDTIKDGLTAKNGQAKKDNQAEKNDQAGEDNRAGGENRTEEDKIVETHNEKDKSTNKKEKDINNLKKPAGKEDKNTYALENNKNAKVKKEAAPKQIEGTSTGTAGESYTVRKGDTLFLIAQKFGVSVDYLMGLNGLYSDIIYENQVLKIKDTGNNSTYQVVSRGGDRSEDLYWLSRLIISEAVGEPYKGKVAVGNVILNRANSGLFPNTIKGVVFDKQNGYVQFSPVIDGTIYNAPSTESVKAATEALNGSRPVGNALYFLNPRQSTNFWIVNNRRYMTTIGLHDFYY